MRPLAPACEKELSALRPVCEINAALPTWPKCGPPCRANRAPPKWWKPPKCPPWAWPPTCPPTCPPPWPPPRAKALPASTAASRTTATLITGLDIGTLAVPSSSESPKKTRGGTKSSRPWTERSLCLRIIASEKRRPPRYPMVTLTLPDRALRRGHDLSGIEDILRIERALERTHGVQRLGSELGLQIFLLALADAVLARAGSTHRLRALDHAVHELIAPRHLLGVVNVAKQRAMEVAVADMADDRRHQIELLQILFGFGDAVGEARDRHADVRRDNARAGTHGLHRPIGIVPRLPQFAAILRTRGPGEIAAAAFFGDLAEIPGLFGDLGLAAVEFEQQQRRFRQGQFRIGVAGLDLRGVEQLNPRDGDAHLDRHDRRLAGSAHGFEGACRSGDGLGNAAQLDGELADDPERAFGADEQMCQVIAGRRFFRPGTGLDDLAVAAHHFQRQHVLAHGAIAHRVGAGRPRRGHAAK